MANSARRWPIAVIGGLIVSTGLSLVFVPAIFVLMDDLSRQITRIFSRFVGERDDPEDAALAHSGHPANDGRTYPVPPRVAAE